MSQIDHTKLIMAALLHDEEYTRSVLPHLHTEYFDGPEDRWFIETFDKYFAEHNALPPRQVFDIEVSSNESLSESDVESLTSKLDEVTKENWQRAISKSSEKWLRSTTEQWCRDRALYNAVRKSVDAVSNNKTGKPPEWMPAMFQEALSVSFDGAHVHDFFANADDRFEFYHQTLQRLPFAIQSINKTLRGNGLPRKSLGIVVAPTGVGKTMFMTNDAAYTLKNGSNVLYITLEIAEEYISERVETALFDMSVDEVEMLEYHKYRSKIDQLRESTQGDLKVREYPPSSISCLHIESLIHELRTKEDFVPDKIYVDYLNLLGTARETKGDNSYNRNKKVAEDLRSVAVKNEAVLISATQTNREGQNASDFELNEVSESHGVSMTADWMGAMISTAELEAMDQMTFKQLKNRFGSLTPTAWRIGMQRHKFKMYDVDNIDKAISDNDEPDEESNGLGLIV